MTVLYKALLIISSTSFSLHAMEPQTLIAHDSTKDIHSTKPNLYYIQDLYNKTYATLATHKANDMQCSHALSEIIKKTKELKESNIDEKHIGSFAFQQEDSIKNKVFASGKPPYNGPHYVSVFFEKLAQYTKNLEKNNFVSPTPEQFALYKNNQKIITAINKASTIRLFIDIQKINVEKNLLIDLDNNIATHEFEQLIDDVTRMLSIVPEEIKTISEILYGGKK